MSHLFFQIITFLAVPSVSWRSKYLNNLRPFFPPSFCAWFHLQTRLISEGSSNILFLTGGSDRVKVNVNNNVKSQAVCVERRGSRCEKVPLPSEALPLPPLVTPHTWTSFNKRINRLDSLFILFPHGCLKMAAADVWFNSLGSRHAAVTDGMMLICGNGGVKARWRLSPVDDKSSWS